MEDFTYILKISKNKLEIDQLEKTIIKEQKQLKFQEEFRFWLLLAIACLAVEFALKKIIYKSFI